MLEDQSDILERLRNRTLTDTDIQDLLHLLQHNVQQDISQSGKYGVALGQGDNNHIGDVYNGLTLDDIRALIQEIIALQTTTHDSSTDLKDPDLSIDDVSFRKLVLDQSTLNAINRQLGLIEEIWNAGCLPPSQQENLTQLIHRLSVFHTLNEELQTLAEQGNALIKQATNEMRLQLDALKLSSQKLTTAAQAQMSDHDLVCQQEEVEIFHAFSNRLEDSRAGAALIGKNNILLAKYACKKLHSKLEKLGVSAKGIEEFEFSLKQFLEQVEFSLYWGSYQILNSPEIPLIVDIELYEEAFRLIRKGIPKQLRPETTEEINKCFDYLIERLEFYV